MKLKYLKTQWDFNPWVISKKLKKQVLFSPFLLAIVMAISFTPLFAQTTSISGFTLVNAETNEDIMPLMDGDELVLSMLPTMYLNIRAEIDGDAPGSVVFKLNETNPFRIENVAPFALAGDNEGDYHPFTPPIGMHTVTATPYTESAGKGDAGAAKTISFKVVSGKMTGFMLINADTDEAIQPLKDGDKINLKGLPTQNLNIKATFDAKSIGSVVFGLNEQSKFRTENVYPYALVGDTDGDYNGFTPPFGMHTVTATPYEKANGEGMKGMSMSVTFEVTDCDVDGAEVSTLEGETTVYTCPGDGIDDIIMVMNSSNSKSEYAYIVTDPDLNVLGLPPGNEVNVEGAGAGTCLIWGLSYTGNITVKVGDNVGELAGLTDECWDLSDNYVKLIRDMPDGGTVSTMAGDTVVYTCPGDGMDDIIMAMHMTESNSKYAYVVTDPNLNVLGLPPGNEVNVEGAGAGTCLIWGLSYTGNITVKVGDNVGELAGLTDECWDLSDNYVKLVRDMPDGGTVSTVAGDTVVYTCPGDGIDDVIMAMHMTESNSKYAYVVTDPNLNVLGLPPGNEVNVEGAGAGTCLIWGLSYTGNITVKVGDNVGELAGLTDECWDLSDNYVKLVRDMPDGGTVSTVAGDTVVYTCPGDGIDDVIMAMHMTESNSKYAYVVTDPNLNVLGLPPGNEVNVEGAGAGTCLIWGLSYTGNITVKVGDNVGELAGLTDECWDLSDNYVKLIRDMPDGGTVSTMAGDTVVYTCPGDGIDDIIMAMYMTESNSKYAYVVTDPNLNVLGLPPGNEVNVEGAGAGTCLIWGLSYTGNITVKVGDNVGELAGLTDECWDLSDNYVKLVRDMPDGGTVSTVAGDTVVYTCPGDGIDDVIMAMHMTESNSKYAYVVTDPNLNVLGLPPGNEVNVEGAGAGTCLIWGLSYTGNITVKVGDNVGELDGLTDECWDLSDNYVKLVRDMPDGGTVSTVAGDTLVNTCPGDGVDDIIMAMHVTESNSNYAYVVTDENLNVLGLPPGSEVNVEGAGEGVCLIWGLSYTGNITIKVGDNVGEVDGLTDECWDLSDNYVKLVRDKANCASGSAFSSNTNGNNLRKASSISVYPNPFVEEINISLDRDFSQPAGVKMFNASGKEIFSQSFKADYQERFIKLNVGDQLLNKGIYFLRIIGQKGDIETLRLIKN